MQLYLMRHEEAESELTDVYRPLSKTGRNDIQRVAAFVQANLAINVKMLFHSGKTRARETAEILSSSVTSSEPMQVDDHLSPNADPEIWKDRLVGERTDLMLVGHLPRSASLGRAACLRGSSTNSGELLYWNAGVSGKP